MPRVWIKPLLKYLLGFAVLALVLWLNWESKDGEPGLRDALAGPKRLDLLALVGLCLAPPVFFTIWRWYVLVRALDLPLTPRAGLRLGLIGYFFNALLPGAIGGDLVKAAALMRTQDRRTRAVASLLADRAIGLVGLALVVVLSGTLFALTSNPLLTAKPRLWTVYQIAVASTAVVAVLWYLLGFLPEWRVNRFNGRLLRLPKVGVMLSEGWLSLVLYRQRPRAVAVAIGLSVVAHVMNVLGFHIASRVFVPAGANVPTLTEHYILVPIGMTVRALFPSPGGMGGSEFGYKSLYHLIERTGALAVLASLAVLVTTWMNALIAYFIGLRIKVVDEKEPTR